MRFAIGQRRARTLRRWGSAGWPTTAGRPAEPVKGMDTFVVLLTLDDDDLYGAEDDDDLRAANVIGHANSSRKHLVWPGGSAAKCQR